MKDAMDHDEHVCRLSALLDGESPDPERDGAWMRADAARAEQYGQYKTLGELLRGLSVPQASEAFNGRVLTNVSLRQRNRRRWSFAGAVAALLLLATAAFLGAYWLGDSGETAPPPVLQAQAGMFYDETDYGLWLALSEMRGGMRLDSALALLEHVPGDMLVAMLATLPATDDEPLPSATPFVAVHELYDSLDGVEREAVNAWLEDLRFGHMSI